MRLRYLLIILGLIGCTTDPEPTEPAFELSSSWYERELVLLDSNAGDWEIQMTYEGKQDKKKLKNGDWKNLLEDLQSREVKKALQQAQLSPNLHQQQQQDNCILHEIKGNDPSSKLKSLSWKTCGSKLTEVKLSLLQQTAIFSSEKTIHYLVGEAYKQSYWECLPGGDTVRTEIVVIPWKKATM